MQHGTSSPRSETRSAQVRISTLVWISSAATFALVLLLAALRYSLMVANGLDLGIYAQVLWNTVHGHWFAFSIHPHSYLGDHLEIILVLLAPFAAAFRAVPTLLTVQAFAWATVGPLGYLVARRWVGGRTATVFAVLLLLSPFGWNAGLFEFHLLTLAAPVLLGAIVAYEANRLGWFYGLLAASLLIREDLALVVLGFGCLALWERRGVSWWLAPVVAGTLWFVGALALIPHLAQYPQDKFLAYYGWLGSTPTGVLTGLVTKPGAVLLHLASAGNLALLVGLLGAFAFLPLAGLRRTVPMLPALAQYLLSGSAGVALGVHYPIPMVPFLFWAALAGYARLTSTSRERGGVLRREPLLAGTILVAVALYSAVFLGPIPRAAFEIVRLTGDPRTQVRQVLAANLPTSRPLAAGYAFLAPASERAALYSLHYQYRGHLQLSEAPYAIPNDAESAVWDFDDVLAYQSLYTEVAVSGHDAGADRLAAFWTERHQRVVVWLDTYALTERSSMPSPLPYSVDPPAPAHPLRAELGHGISMEGFDGLLWETTNWFGRTVPTVNVGITVAASAVPGKTYNLLLRFTDADGHVRTERLLALAYGFHPTMNWAAGERVRTDYRLALDPHLAGTTASVTLVDANLPVELTSLRSIAVRPPQHPSGPSAVLGVLPPYGLTW